VETVFRTDASLDIGTGHVIRCLTLADALRQRGMHCRFICRDHPGNLSELIGKRGYIVHILPYAREHVILSESPFDPLLSSCHPWLGLDWYEDAQQTVVALNGNHADWLIVDHYALDSRWEQVLKTHCKKLLVIDDLADRPHVCDMLLDQNLGRDSNDYDSLVPDHCLRLIGPQNALLRPEFASHREFSLQRRKAPVLKHVLIAMGGIDQPNAAGQVLEALNACPLPADCKITVVMGGKAPWIERVRAISTTMNWPTEVLIDINDMARVMSEADLAIGAAGSTSWERCCLGLPTLLFVLADNQKSAAFHMSRTGVSYTLVLDQTLVLKLQHFVRRAVTFPEYLSVMSSKAAAVTSGKGSDLVINAMIHSGKNESHNSL
jgi:UDP-2,4-diacetamido-2,4,6-trideoxy-beta-L-altropyranose hydrolase